MSNDIKYTYAALKRADGTVSRKRIYAVTSSFSALYQLRYYYMQGYTNQDKRILDVLNEGLGPLDRSLEEAKILKKQNFKPDVEGVMGEKFRFHSKEIILETESFDVEQIRESKETQRILQEYMQKNARGSHSEYLKGLFIEYQIKGSGDIRDAIEHYQRGHSLNFCQFCTAKLLRMNLETMELKLSSLTQNCETAFDICGYIFVNSGIFYFYENSHYHSPVFYYISVMMDIYREFRDFVYQK